MLRLRVSLLLPLLLLALPATAEGRRAWAPGEVIVKFRADGLHALEECAEELTRQGRRLAPYTADGSDSLDRLHERLRVRGVRALFRRPDGRAFREQRRKLARRLDAARRRRGAPAALPDLAHVYLVRIPDELDVPYAVEQYRDDPHVVYAQPNYRASAQALEDGLPDDPFFATSGSWGQPYEDLWGLLRIRADLAWKVARGEGIVVAVNDTGLDHRHPDIAANVWANPGEDLNGNGIAEGSDRNGIDDDGNGFVDDIRGFDFHNSVDWDADGRYDGPRDLSDSDPFDDNGHGTHVAGTIAAVGDNGIGLLGVAPRARIMVLKALGAGGGGTTSNLSRAIVYAAENGAQIVSNSWSCVSRCPSNPLAEEAVRLAYGLGTVVVFSAGNRSDDVAFFSPQNMAETITVAASDPADEAASFSNRGFLVDVSAPGAGFPQPPPDQSPSSAILSLRSSATSPGLEGSNRHRVVAGKYLRLAGTSMSAPHVAGVAALLLSRRPELGPDEVKTVLRLTAEDVGAPGTDRRHGAGRVDAAAALALDAIPQLRARLTAPAQLETLPLRGGSVEIVGSATGADFREYRLFVGAGIEPDLFEPIGPPGLAPVEDGVLGSWSLEDAEEGPHVIRLAVTSQDGAVIEAFASIGLERNPGHVVAATSEDDVRPSISGNRVAFETRYSVSGEDEGWNVFGVDLDATPPGEPYPLVDSPDDEGEPVISGDRVVWESVTDNLPKAGTCRIGPDRTCEPHFLPTAVSVEPDVSGDRIVWLANAASGLAIMLCEVEAGTEECVPRELSSGFRFGPAIDGTRVAWSEVGTIATCSLDPTTGDCPVQHIPPLVGALDSPDVSGDLIAWIEYAPDFKRQFLRVCRLDPVSGACPVVEIPTSGQPVYPEVSGSRVVWDDIVDGFQSEVFFCEHDPETLSCPPQRLTGSLGTQKSPSMDGNWVVWQDGRGGGDLDIFALELPSLDPIGGRRVREGRHLVVPVHGRDPFGDPVRLEVTQVDGSPVEALGAVFRDFGNGRGELRWTPRFDQAGSYPLRFRMTTAGLLHTGESIRIEVENVNRPPVVVTDRFRLGRVGEPLRLDACDSRDPDGDALRFRWKERRHLLGEDCTLDLAPPRRPGVSLVAVLVSDGQDTSAGLVLVRWAPKHRFRFPHGD